MQLRSTTRDKGKAGSERRRRRLSGSLGVGRWLHAVVTTLCVSCLLVSWAERPAIAAEPEATAKPAGVSVRSRTNYYIDNDGNRIVTPLVAADAEVSDTVSIAAHTALDVMTCASVDVTTAATPKGYFQETRKEAAGSVTYKRDLARLTLTGTHSQENDYASATAGISLSDEFAQRNTTLSLAYSFTDSDVGRAKDPYFQRDLKSHALTLAWTQVLTPRWLVQVSSFSNALRGMQSSVYRRVRFTNGAAGAEVVPNVRLRQALVVQLRGALTRTWFTGASYRLYVDSWGLQSHTAAAQLSYMPRRWLTLRLRERFYVQRGVDFYSAYFTQPMRYMSIDRELGDFWGNLVGVKADVFLADFGQTTTLGFDLKLDYMRQVFADFPWLPVRRMWIAEAGVRLTF